MSPDLLTEEVEQTDDCGELQSVNIYKYLSIFLGNSCLKYTRITEELRRNVWSVIVQLEVSLSGLFYMFI